MTRTVNARFAAWREHRDVERRLAARKVAPFLVEQIHDRVNTAYDGTYRRILDEAGDDERPGRIASIE